STMSFPNWSGARGRLLERLGMGASESDSLTPSRVVLAFTLQTASPSRVDLGVRIIHQRVLAHSDIDRSYSYEFVGAAPFPVEDYQATIRVLPIVADGRSLVEWWATFDCALEAREKWVRYFEQEGFAVWLAALARFMAR